MLPGCMSAWKKPSRNTWVKKMVTPSRASFLKSTPASRRRCTWPMGTPFMRSITMTVGVHRSHTISGTITSPRSCMLRRSCVAFAASRTRSSSSCKWVSNSATTSRGFKRRPSALKRSTQRARVCSSSRSRSMAACMPGRSTLTATSRPAWASPMRPGRSARRRAKCTWAMEALATGSASKRSNSASSGRPSARSTSAADCAAGNGGTRSCSRASSSARSGGTRSRRVDSTCPNFTKMGPRRSRAWRSRTPRGAFRSRPTVTTLTSRRTQGCRKLCNATSSRPKRRTVKAMNHSRARRLIAPSS